MKEAELDRFGALLYAKRDEILRDSGQRQSIVIENAPDPLDVVQLARERDFAARMLESEARLLSDVQNALIRIREGVYGICLQCEEPIAEKRLAVVPWAPLCIKCQELRDVRRLDDNAESYPDMAA